MRKVLFLLLACCLVLGGCGKSENPKSGSQVPEISKGQESAEEPQDIDIEGIEAIGEIEVDKKIFDVELSIPADFIEGKTQEDLDRLAEERGFKSITLNEDGSATYIMTKGQHKEFVEEFRATINKSLDEMINSEDYQNFTKIETNEDFTEFRVTTKSDQAGLVESLSAMALYMYGGAYGIVSGNRADNVSVTYINEGTGDIVATFNSKDMQN